MLNAKIATLAATALIQSIVPVTGISQSTVDFELGKAELKIIGNLAMSAAEGLGLTSGPFGELELEIHADGSLKKVNPGNLPLHGKEVYVSLGGSKLVSENADEYDIDAVVVTGASAKLIYYFLQQGRQLSLDIDRAGSCYSGKQIRCVQTYAKGDRAFSCAIPLFGKPAVTGDEEDGTWCHGAE